MNSAAPTEEPDFDTLWNQEAGEPASPQAQSAPAQAPAPAAANEPEPAAPQAAPAQAEPPAPATAAAPEAQAPAEDDWFAALPEEVQGKIKAERTAAQERYDALHGRVRPLQQQLSRLQARPPQPAAPTPQPQPVAVQPNALEDFFKSETWQEYEKSYPGDAKVYRAGLERQAADVNGKIGSLEQQLSQLQSQLSATTGAVQSTVLETQISVLEAAHPDWREYDASDEFWQWFDDWRVAQPKEVRDVYYDTAKLNAMWSDAEFAVARIAEYKAAHPKTAQPTPAPAAPDANGQPHPQPTPEQPAPTASAAQVRLSMAASPDIKGGAKVPTAVPLETMSEEARFEALWAEEERRAAAQR